MITDTSDKPLPEPMLTQLADASANWVNIGSGNGLSLVWRQAIIQTDADLLYPPHNEVVGGYIGFTPSVHLSVRPSVLHPVSAL